MSSVIVKENETLDSALRRFKRSCAKAGIQQGDFILSVDGRKTETTNSLLSALLRHSAGETVGILLYRAGAHLTVAVTLDERPQTVQQPSDEPPAEVPNN